jgi:hypothetical protein
MMLDPICGRAPLRLALLGIELRRDVRAFNADPRRLCTVAATLPFRQI